MRAVVVYESMYGNTHVVADHIGEGLGESAEVIVTSVDGATPEVLVGADVLIVGGPTHAHGMTSKTTRKAAVDDGHNPDKDLELDPDAEGPGLRDWFGSLDAVRDDLPVAAFDTRFDASPMLTGRASKGIARKLRHHGFRLVAEPESFLVDKQTQLLDGEVERARAWGASLLGVLENVSPASDRR